MEENKGKDKSFFNFLPSEEMLLMQEVVKFQNIIQCRRNDKANNYEKKQAWIKITAKFNAKRSNQQARSVEELRSKYENLMKQRDQFVADMKYGQDPSCDPIIPAMMRISPTGQTGYNSPAVIIRPVSFKLPHKEPFINRSINKNILLLKERNLTKMNEEYDLRKIEKRDEEDRQRKRERDEEDQKRQFQRDQEDSRRKHRRDDEDWRKKLQREVEDLQRECEREEEKHEIKMKLLRLELKSKEEQLKKN